MIHRLTAVMNAAARDASGALARGIGIGKNARARDSRGVKPLRPAAKCGIVIAGLVLALVLAVAAILVRQQLMPGPDAIASSGMHAFGDLVLGLGVFSVAGSVPLVLALRWLRAVAAFWRIASAAAVVASATGPLWLVASAVLQPGSPWSVSAPLRVLAMPVLSALSFTTGTFAPERRERWLFWGAATIETVGFATTVLVKIVLPLAR